MSTFINNRAWKTEKTNYNTEFLKHRQGDILTKNTMVNHMSEDEKENKNANR